MITFGHSGNAAKFLNGGWSAPEAGFTWTMGTEAVLLVPNPGPYACRMKIRYDAFRPPGRAFQRVAISLDGSPVASWMVSDHGEVDLWLRQEIVARAGDPMQIRIELPDAASPRSFTSDNADDRMLGLAFHTLEIESIFDDASAVALADAARGMESLGSNCEFGLVQRFCGAEPLGLLRFSSSRMDSLVPALEARFEGLGSPGSLEFIIRGEHSEAEWITLDQRYGFVAHTMQTPERVSQEQMLRIESQRLPRLAEKLICDLEAAEKLFVYQGDLARSAEVAMPLLEAIRRYNRTNVLLLVLADPNKSGRVEQYCDGLMLGYVGRLTDPAYARDFSIAPWISIVRRASKAFCRMRNGG